MDIFEQLKIYVLDTNNGKGKELTNDIEGCTANVDTISFYYSKKASAEKLAEDIRNEFNVVVNVLDHIVPGIITVYIIPQEV